VYALHRHVGFQRYWKDTKTPPGCVFWSLSLSSKKTCAASLLPLWALSFPKNYPFIFFNLCKPSQNCISQKLISVHLHLSQTFTQWPIRTHHRSSTTLYWRPDLRFTERFLLQRGDHQQSDLNESLRQPCPSVQFLLLAKRESKIVSVSTSYHLLNIMPTFIILCPPICPNLSLYINISK